MLSLLIAFILGAGSFYGCYAAGNGAHPVWSVLAGVAAFLIVNLLINLMLRPRLMAVFNGVQNEILEDQAVLRRKANAMMGHGGPAAMAKLEQEQFASIRRAIAALDALKKYEKWSPMIRKQTDTLKAQFYFQIREYEQADLFLKSALLMDPLLVAMQMARYYKKGEMEALKKCYEKGIRRFRNEKAVILYAAYSWMLLQEKKVDEAIQVLVAGEKNAPNPILHQNWDALVNGKTSRFSNAGLGDVWYALYLEQPRMQRVQQPAYGGYRR